VQAAGVPAATERHLLRTVSVADRWLAQAETLTGTRRDRALRTAAKKLTRAVRRLTTLSARRQIADPVRAELSDRASELEKSITMLRTQP